MKSNVEQQEEEFSPINVSICIETEKELQELWHRFNITVNMVKKGVPWWGYSI